GDGAGGVSALRTPRSCAVQATRSAFRADAMSIGVPGARNCSIDGGADAAVGAWLDAIAAMPTTSALVTRAIVFIGPLGGVGNRFFKSHQQLGSHDWIARQAVWPKPFPTPCGKNSSTGTSPGSLDAIVGNHIHRLRR